MNKLLTIITLIFFLSLSSYAQSVPEFLQSISVTIKTGESQGSGVIFTRTNKLGEQVSFVWSAGHVVARLRTEREIIDFNGTKKTVVEFKDAQVLQLIVEDGRTIGRVLMDAAIIKYSDADYGDDLALLRVRKKNFTTNTVTFFLKNAVLPVGTKLYHCGSLQGEQGGQSLTDGILSANGRLVNGKEYTQSSIVALPGSSGGGVYNQDKGECVGFILRGSSDVVNLYCPISRVKSWATKNNVMWALDPSIPLPGDSELDELSIEDKMLKKDSNKELKVP